MPGTNQTAPLQATVLHHVPGRIRLRVLSAKGDHRRLEELQHGLWPLESVRQVTTNPVTGTVVIHYDPQQFAHFPARLVEADMPTKM